MHPPDVISRYLTTGHCSVISRYLLKCVSGNVSVPPPGQYPGEVHTPHLVHTTDLIHKWVNVLDINLGFFIFP